MTTRKANIATADSGLIKKATAIAGKDIAVEWRTRQNLFIGLLFGIASLTAIGLTVSSLEMSASLRAVLLWVVLLFQSLSTLTRVFSAEIERNTADRLRLSAEPTEVYLGKLLFNSIIALGQTVVAAPLFAWLIGFGTADWFWLAAIIFLNVLVFAAAITLCSALSAISGTKSPLTAVLALPVLLPPLAMAVSGTAATLRAPFDLYAVLSTIGGLVAYYIATAIASLLLFRYAWRD